jgi:hypothetical protein
MKKFLLISILITILISGLNFTFAQNVKRTLKQAVFTTPTINPKSIIVLYDSIYYWNWDTISKGWIFSKKTINIVYDTYQDLSSELFQVWNSALTTWVNTGRANYTYNANKYQTSELNQSWNNPGWVNHGKDTMIYDANNNMTSEMDQSLINTTIGWRNNRLYMYSYDSQNNQTSFLYQQWNGVTNTWVNEGYYTYTYDTNNNMTVKLYQTWNGLSWVNSSKDTMIYDNNNNRTNKLDLSWNGTAWANLEKDTMEYDANNNLTSELYQSWNSNAWVNYKQNIYTYDASNNMTGELEQSWNGSTWVIANQYTYAFDINNLEESAAWKEWNNTGSYIIWGDSTYYYFQTLTGINELYNKLNIMVYPNPALNNITIESMQKSTIELLNIQGQTIKQQQIQQGKTDIDLSELSKGVYILRLCSNDKTEVTRIVKE